MTSELVAFLDSDCVPEAGWIERLAAHLADPAVAVAAPRILPVPGGHSWADRYSAAGSSLDMGGQEGRVAPGTRLSYVPTAALLARRPVLAGLGFAGSVLAMRAALHRAGLPDRGVLPAMLRATQQTWLGIGRYSCQFAAPVLAAALAAPGGRPAHTPAP